MKTELPHKEPDYWFEGDKMYCYVGYSDIPKRIKLPLWVIRKLKNDYGNGLLYEKERIRKLLGL